MKKVMKKEKMPWAVILSFGLLFAGWSFAWAIYNNFVPIFLQAGNINFDKAGVVLISGFGLSPAMMAIIMSIDNVAMLVGAPLVGMLSDKVGKRKPFIAISLPIAIAAFIMLPVTVGMVPAEYSGMLDKLIFPFALLMGLASLFLLAGAFTSTPSYAMRYQLIPSKYRSEATGWIQFIGSLGSMVGFLLGGILYNIDYRLPFIVFGGLFFIIYIIFMLVTREPANWVTIAETQDGMPIKTGLASLKLFTRPELKNILFAIGIFACFVLGSSNIQTHGSSYVVAVLGKSEALAAQLGTLFFLGLLIGTIPSGYFPRLIGRKGTLRAAAVGVLIVALALFIVQNFSIFLVLIFFLGFFFAAVEVNVVPMLSEICPSPKMMGVTLGFFMTASALASIISVPLGGVVYSLTSYRMLWIVMAVGALGAAVLTFGLTMGEAKDDQLDDQRGGRKVAAKAEGTS